MKLTLALLVLLALSGCAGKKLMKDCTPVGKNEKGAMLSECYDI